MRASVAKQSKTAPMRAVRSELLQHAAFSYYPQLRRLRTYVEEH
jgi:hypothetical protein